MSILIKGTNIEDLQRAMLMFSGHEIVELPEHGDLIDREALKKTLIDEGETVGIDGFSIDGLSADDVCYAIENAPVVIPEERSEDECTN